MLKKIAVTALMSGFAIASFAQAGAMVVVPPKTDAPATTEQKADAPHCEKHGKHHRCHHKKGEHEAKSEDKASSSAAPAAPVAPAKK